MLKIWDDAENGQRYFLKLVYANEGVKLVVLDGNGEDVPGGNILIIDNEGELYRYPAISTDIVNALGIKVTSKRKIKVYGVYEVD